MRQEYASRGQGALFERSLAQYPLIVAVGTSQTEALASFYEREHNYYTRTALFSLFVIVFGASLMVALSRQKRAMISVARSEARFRATFDQAAIVPGSKRRRAR